MARANLAAIAFGFIFLAGCSSSELDNLRASVARYKCAAQKAQAEANDAAAKAKKRLAEAAELSRRAIAQLEEAQHERDAGVRARTEADAILADAYAVQAQNEAEREDLELRLRSAQEIIDQAATARVELANLQLVSGELQQLATAAREDRKAAEVLKREAIRIRNLVAAETQAAAAEQRAATAAIEATRLERAAAEDAMEAAKLAKEEVAMNRASLDQERLQLATAREEVEQRAAAAAAMLAKAEAKRAAAKQVGVEAARQQLLLAEQLVALDAAREAASISQIAAQQAWAILAAERRAAERSAVSADVARREATATFDYVRSVLQQLREMTAGNVPSDEDNATYSGDSDLSVAERPAAISE